MRAKPAVGSTETEAANDQLAELKANGFRPQMVLWSPHNRWRRWAQRFSRVENCLGQCCASRRSFTAAGDEIDSSKRDELQINCGKTSRGAKSFHDVRANDTADECRVNKKNNSSLTQISGSPVMRIP